MAVNSGKDSVERRLRINALLVGETGRDKTGFINTFYQISRFEQ